MTDSERRKRQCAVSFPVHFVKRAIGAKYSTCWIILCTSEHFLQVCARAKLSAQEMTGIRMRTIFDDPQTWLMLANKTRVRQTMKRFCCFFYYCEEGEDIWEPQTERPGQSLCTAPNARSICKYCSRTELRGASTCMRIPVISWADSFARAHTWRKCSLVHKIIQHVEYLAPMARVTQCTGNDTAHWRFLLTESVTNEVLLSR